MKQNLAINDAGIEIITYFEGFSKTPYLCPAGVWTIGYGSTYTPEGERVSEKTKPLTKVEAVHWLRHDLKTIEGQLARLIIVPVHQNQFSALVSFTYNVGSGNFRASTLRQKLNRYDYEGASFELPKWRRAQGKILKGLVKRRNAEKELFNKPDAL